ncbi:unnamed protein product [Meganyctiphanes norvegica]|uniref:Uncharacterized protein n=1 Tax=Meganyctiphanes norvegica TaxID=48144 RepID=A0AAV2SNW0_MEGNR
MASNDLYQHHYRPKKMIYQKENNENQTNWIIHNKTFDCMDAKQVSKYGPGKRFLPLGDHLVCRLYDDFMTVPRLEDYSYEDSNHLDRINSFLKDGKNPWKYHSVTRTFLNLKNLMAVRGPTGLLKNSNEQLWEHTYEKEFVNQSMIGPCDYFGYLKEPHTTAYRIILGDEDNEEYNIDKNTGLCNIFQSGMKKRNGLPIIIGYKEKNTTIIPNYENAKFPVILDDPESELLTRQEVQLDNEVFKFNCLYKTLNGNINTSKYSFSKSVYTTTKDIFTQREIFPDNYASDVQVEWISGKSKVLQDVKQKQLSEDRPIVSSILKLTQLNFSSRNEPLKRGHHWNLPSLSLFPNPGIILFPSANITIRRVDGRHYDLSSFKAQLVKHNRTPFRIPSAKGDQYKIITYSYGKDYADKYILNTDGLFIEHHEFAQIITPVNRESRGFVILARIPNGSNKDYRPTKAEIWKAKLEFIGVEIPYGWTLVIQKDSLHGDSTLQGMYMMCMTADHNDMSTANAAFLKSETTIGTLENVRIELSDDQTACTKTNTTCQIPKVFQPMILDNTKTSVDTVNRVIDDSPLPTFKDSGGMVLTKVIFNPMSKSYRRLITKY